MSAARFHNFIFTDITENVFIVIDNSQTAHAPRSFRSIKEDFDIDPRLFSGSSPSWQRRASPHSSTHHMLITDINER